MENIPKFYENKNILITGVTGFVGRVLLEKLLRDCSKVKKIYVLVRSKADETPQDRYQKLIQHEIFDVVRETQPEQLRKVQVISGDIAVDTLSLGVHDHDELLANVNIIIHCAACVRFTDKLKNAVNINTVGTLRMLNLAENMKNFKSFCFISSAYAHCYQDTMEERYCPTHINPFDVIKSVNECDDDSLDKLEARLLSMGFPNTFTLSKALTEEILMRYQSKLPIVIVRAPTIFNAVKDPVKGYVEAFGVGIILLLSGFMTGLVRWTLHKKNVPVRITAVDFVVNCAIVAACKRSVSAAVDLLVYNCSTNDDNKTWDKMAKIVIKNVQKYPLSEKVMWYPRWKSTASVYRLKIYLYIFQLLPAFLFDAILMLLGKKPMVVKTQFKIIKTSDVLNFSLTKKVTFKNEKLHELHNELNDDDSKVFDFNHKQLNLEEYFEESVKGFRKFIFHEDEATLNKARKRLWAFYIADIVWGIFMLLVTNQVLKFAIPFIIKSCFKIYYAFKLM